MESLTTRQSSSSSPAPTTSSSAEPRPPLPPASSSSSASSSASASSTAMTVSKVLDVQQLDDYLLSDVLLGTSTSIGSSSSGGGGGGSNIDSSRPLSYILQCALELALNISNIMTDYYCHNSCGNNSSSNNSSSNNKNSIMKKTSMLHSSIITKLIIIISRNINNNDSLTTMMMSTMTKRIIESATIQNLIVRFLTLIVTQGRTPAVQALNLDTIDTAGLGTAGTSSFNQHQHQHQQLQLQQEQQVRRRRRRRWRRILVFAVLETIVPFWYEYYIKQKALRWLSSSSTSTSTSSSLAMSSGDEAQLQQQQQQQRLVVLLKREERRRLLVQKFLQTMDTILPLVRLGLLMNTWTRRRRASSSSPPNLAMALSGLQYGEKNGGVNAMLDGDDASPPSPKNNAMLTSASSFFVLYAHRRWIHQEAVKLWTTMGEPLLRTCNNTAQQFRTVLNSTMDNHRHRRRQQQRHQRRLRRRQQQQQQQQQLHQDGGGPTVSSDTTTATSSSSSLSLLPCPFCQREHQQIVVPYKMEKCGHVACYVCLWKFVKSHCRRHCHRDNNASLLHPSSPSPLPPCCCPICDEDIVHCSQVVSTSMITS